MIRPSSKLALLSFLILAGCGGSTDAPAPQAMSGAPVIATRPQAELGAPITNEGARAAQARERASGIGFQQQESALVVDGAPMAVDTSDRESVRGFFNRIYNEPPVPLGWTGNHARGEPGATSADFKRSTVQRMNWYRAMAGLPAAVRLSEANSAKAQHAALIMSVAGALSHYPPADWRFRTPEGLEAARSSNLALVGNGPDAIDQYIQDYGASNAPVGHRRWILHPNMRTTGTGDVPAGVMEGRQLVGANALWVHDVDFAGPRAPVRDDFVAWPAKGYVPYPTVFERWSFSYPDADFRQATVTVTRNGVALAIGLEAVVNGYGENTLVWKMPGIDASSGHARPAADVRYRVSIANVMVAQRSRSFDYEVTVFDPSVPTPGAPRPLLSAPAQATLAEPFTARIAPLSGASGYSLTSFLAKALDGARPAPFDAATWTAANGGTHAIIDGGKLRFYVTSSEWNMQSATLNKQLFVAGSGGRVLINRARAYTTTSQWFQAQVSVDDGRSWSMVYNENGDDRLQAPSSVVPVPLAAYAGQAIRLRIVAGASGSAYTGAQSGWTVNSVGFDGIQELADRHEHRNTGGEFTLTFAKPGSWVLVPRAERQGLYDTDPGAAAVVHVDGALLTGPRSAYSITRHDGVLTIVDTSGRDGTQTVRDPFRIDFSDQTLAFDIDGNAGRTYRLYRAAFNRKPDGPGLGFWIRAMDSGLTLDSLAQEFARSDEFRTLYGAAPSREQIIQALYGNVLHRLPDQTGAQYWLEQLENGLPLERLLIGFSESVENQRQVAAEVEAGIAYPRQ